MTRPRTPRGFFSLDELLQPPNVMSALRLPLAALFPLAAKSKRGAMLVLAAAGVTDLLDGWLARRSGVVTTTGAVLDPIADKVFAVSVVGTLAARGSIPRWGIPALLAREILEAPLIAWIYLQRRDDTREAVETEVHATLGGKLATTTQFAAVLAALEAPALLTPALVATAVLGTAAGIAYIAREVERERLG